MTATPRRPISSTSSTPGLCGPWANNQRCILPAAGFYAWLLTQEKFRRPFFIRLAARSVFGDRRGLDRSEGDDGDIIESCTLITVTANALVAGIDNSAAHARDPPPQGLHHLAHRDA